MTPNTNALNRLCMTSALFMLSLVCTVPCAKAANEGSGFTFWDGKVKSHIYIAQGFQQISSDDIGFEAANKNMESGFQRIRFNIDMSLTLNDIVSAYVDLGEEPNDFGSDDQFEISQDLAYIDIALMPLLQTDNATTNVTFRAGNIVSTVFDFRGYSDGAAVQSNPLIGNSPIDFVTAESGAQLLWKHKTDANTYIYGDIGVTIPTFFEDYSEGRGYNTFGKLGITKQDNWGISLGLFTSNQGEQVGLREFKDIQTAGLIQGDGDNYNFAASGSSSRDTHVGLLPGLDATMYQINGFYQFDESVLVRAWAGMAKDDYRFVDANGIQTVASQAIDYARQESKMRYFAIEGSYYIVPESFYIAARYSVADNTTRGVKNATLLSRSQFGLGWFVAPGTLAKAEYVVQKEEKNSAGQIGSDWSGFSMELSVIF